jgi:hypothetical protein
MDIRSWPNGRMPPPGWVVSPELSEIYGRNIIIRRGSVSKVRRKIGGNKANKLEREGKLQMVLGGLLMGAGLFGRRR